MPVRLILDGAKPSVEWLSSRGRRFEEAFFEDTARRLRKLPENRHPVVTGVEALEEMPPAEPRPTFLFHVSRCGSTLVCALLAALRESLVVSEAPVLDDVLRAHRLRGGVDDADRVAWLRGSVSALARSVRPAPRRLLVKLDAWHLFELDLVRRAFPEATLLFLHRHPLEVLVSLQRTPSLTLVRGTVTPEQLGLTEAGRDALSQEEHGAAIVGALYRAARRHRAELLPIAYAGLPDPIWTSLPGWTFTGDEVETMRGRARTDPKRPGLAFRPDAEEKRSAATPALRAACAAFAEPEYERFLATL